MNNHNLSSDIRKRPLCVIKKTEITESRLKRIKDWATLYRRNLQLFVMHYFGVTTLHNYQKMILYEMGVKSELTISASRATAKSWTIALGGLGLAVLYPNSEIVIVSSTKGQAGVIIGKMQGFINDYPNIEREIFKVVTNNNDRIVYLQNGSKITVVSLSDNSRGIYDKYNLHDKMPRCEEIHRKINRERNLES